MSTIILQLSMADVEVRGRKVKEGKGRTKLLERFFFSFNCSFRKTNLFSSASLTVTMMLTPEIVFQQHATCPKRHNYNPRVCQNETTIRLSQLEVKFYLTPPTVVLELTAL